jgi:hypothetical protein
MSIPGIAQATALSLLAQMPELGSFDQSQVASLAGLAPVHERSPELDAPETHLTMSLAACRPASRRSDIPHYGNVRSSGDLFGCQLRGGGRPIPSGPGQSPQRRAVSRWYSPSARSWTCFGTHTGGTVPLLLRDWQRDLPDPGKPGGARMLRTTKRRCSCYHTENQCGRDPASETPFMPRASLVWLMRALVITLFLLLVLVAGPHASAAESHQPDAAWIPVANGGSAQEEFPMTR